MKLPKLTKLQIINMSIDIVNIINTQLKPTLETLNPSCQALTVDKTSDLGQICRKIETESQELNSFRYLLVLFIYKLETLNNFDEISLNYLNFLTQHFNLVNEFIDALLHSVNFIIEIKVNSLTDIKEILDWCEPGTNLINYCRSINKEISFEYLDIVQMKLIVAFLDWTDNGDKEKIKENALRIIDSLCRAYENEIDTKFLTGVLFIGLCDVFRELLDIGNQNAIHDKSKVDPILVGLKKMIKMSTDDEVNQKLPQDLLNIISSLHIRDDTIPVQVPVQVPGQVPGQVPDSQFHINPADLTINKDVPLYSDSKLNFIVSIFSGKYVIKANSQKLAKDVVVKQFKIKNPAIRAEIENEINICQSLSAKASPETSFIHYYGTIFSDDIVQLVIEAYPKSLVSA